MKRTYVMFDFEAVIGHIRIKNETEKGKESLLKLIDSIPANSSIEDLPLYRDYLAKFNLEHAFGSLELKIPDIMGSKADFDLLQRFVYASFSSTYDLTCDENENKYIVAINVKCKDGGQESITKTIDELWSFQVYRLFEIYLEEMLGLEVLRTEGDEVEGVEEERRNRLLIFEENVKKMKSQQEKKKRDRKNREESLAMESDLDGLLNS